MMSKTITLIRHAKSSWSDPNLPDKFRPLNKRGQRDLPKIGKLLQALEFSPDLLLCSTAKRALETLEGLKPYISIAENNIRFEETLYEADVDHLLAEIKQRSDEVGHLTIIGHNPGLNDLINLLCGIQIGNLPTLGIAQLRFDSVHWTDIPLQQCSLQLLLTPKALD